MLYTHQIGKLTQEDVDRTVTLTGWVKHVRNHGSLIFLDLYDFSGTIQIVIPDHKDFPSIRNEYVIQATGKVSERPLGNENKKQKNGNFEIIISNLKILNKASITPFQIDDHIAVGEEIRLKYRYLDLRRQSINKNIRLRSEVSKIARDFLHQNNFIEIETPTLTRSTPEGARDFIIPSRLNPGSWYALPQSPQLFKQLLQVGGFEKYYQFARCYRDEDFRADRQPEFTQLDIEASFVEEKDIINLTEELIKKIWNLINVKVPNKIKKITYMDAMNKYGSDKPDLRFELEIIELTDVFKKTECKIFQHSYVGAIVMPEGASQTRSQLNEWQNKAKQHGSKGLAYILVKEDGQLTGPIVNKLSKLEKIEIIQKTNANIGDCIFFSSGVRKKSQELLGYVRSQIAQIKELINDNSWSFVWVIDWPMFEKHSDEKNANKWSPTHHAFVAPKKEFMNTFTKNPESAVTCAYDIIVNGHEIGGGSIRIHDAVMQKKVFKIMGLSDSEIEDKFGFLIESFKYGAPPHGGIALGWDRVIALLCGSNSIRDVIAFPKSGNFDHMTQAPSPITYEQRKESGVDIMDK